MNHHLFSIWQCGKITTQFDCIEPRLASWERKDHPSQIRLRAYKDNLLAQIGPLPQEGPLFLDLTVDVGDPIRLQHHYDLENYLTPLFDGGCLPRHRFALVTARKQVGGGSSLRVGTAEPAPLDQVGQGWHHLTIDAGSGAGTKAWKQKIHDAMINADCRILPDGPVQVRLAWRCSPSRNWVSFWKPTGDAMGPVLGYASASNPFHPNDDRIVELELHSVVDNKMGHNVVVGMWWRHLEGLTSCETSAAPPPALRAPVIETTVNTSEFTDDDGGYMLWLEAHPHGFVVNTAKSKSASYMVLHRAACHSISQYTERAKPGGFTERDFIKICADTTAALREWVKQHGRPDGSFSGECSLCKP